MGMRNGLLLLLADVAFTQEMTCKSMNVFDDTHLFKPQSPKMIGAAHGSFPVSNAFDGNPGSMFVVSPLVNGRYSDTFSSGRKGLEFRFKNNLLIKKFTLVTRTDCCRDRYKNVVVYAGGEKIATTPSNLNTAPHHIDFMETAYRVKTGDIWTDSLDLIFEDPRETGQIMELYIDYCEREPLCTDKKPVGCCRGAGDPHYHTFDHKKFDFMGKCQYLLAGVEESGVEDERPWFNVKTQHAMRWLPAQVSMTEHVYIEFRGKSGTKYTIHLYVKDPPLWRPTGFGSSVSTYDEGVGSNRVTVNHMTTEDFSLNNYGRRITVTTWFGLYVGYDISDWIVDVCVPKCYQNVMEGLCGNYNGNSGDDFSCKGGDPFTSVNQCAQTWRTAWEGSHCPAEPTDPNEGEGIEPLPTCTGANLDQAITDCSPLKDETINGKFNPFYPAVEKNLVPSEYENCKFDLCIEPKLRCQKLEAFAGQYIKALKWGNVDLCKWNEVFNCPMDCPLHSQWNACSHQCKIKTCANRQLTDAQRAADCPGDMNYAVGMCECNPGYVLEDGKCVLEAECGCEFEYQPGTKVNVPEGYVSHKCSETFTCTNGNMVAVRRDQPESICLAKCGCKNCNNKCQGETSTCVETDSTQMVCEAKPNMICVGDDCKDGKCMLGKAICDFRPIDCRETGCTGGATCALGQGARHYCSADSGYQCIGQGCQNNKCGYPEAGCEFGIADCRSRGCTNVCTDATDQSCTSAECKQDGIKYSCELNRQPDCRETRDCADNSECKRFANDSYRCKSNSDTQCIGKDCDDSFCTGDDCTFTPKDCRTVSCQAGATCETDDNSNYVCVPDTPKEDCTMNDCESGKKCVINDDSNYVCVPDTPATDCTGVICPAGSSCNTADASINRCSPDPGHECQGDCSGNICTGTCTYVYTGCQEGGASRCPDGSTCVSWASAHRCQANPNTVCTGSGCGGNKLCLGARSECTFTTPVDCNDSLGDAKYTCPSGSSCSRQYGTGHYRCTSNPGRPCIGSDCVNNVCTNGPDCNFPDNSVCNSLNCPSGSVCKNNSGTTQCVRNPGRQCVGKGCLNGVCTGKPSVVGCKFHYDCSTGVKCPTGSQCRVNNSGGYSCTAKPGHVCSYPCDGTDCYPNPDPSMEQCSFKPVFTCTTNSCPTGSSCKTNVCEPSNPAGQCFGDDCDSDNCYGTDCTFTTDCSRSQSTCPTGSSCRPSKYGYSCISNPGNMCMETGDCDGHICKDMSCKYQTTNSCESPRMSCPAGSSCKTRTSGQTGFDCIPDTGYVCEGSGCETGCNNGDCTFIFDSCPNSCWTFNEETSRCEMNKEPSSCYNLECGYGSMKLNFISTLLGIEDNQTPNPFLIQDGDVTFSDGQWNSECDLGECGMTCDMRTIGNVEYIVFGLRLTVSQQAIRINDHDIFLSNPLLKATVLFECAYRSDVKVNGELVDVHSVDATGEVIDFGNLTNGFEINIFVDPEGKVPVDTTDVYIGDEVFTCVDWTVSSLKKLTSFFVDGCQVVVDEENKLDLIKDNCYSATFGVEQLQPEKIVSNRSKFKFTSFIVGEGKDTQSYNLQCNIKVCALAQEEKCKQQIAEADSACPNEPEMKYKADSYTGN